ncbi:MAG: iron complex outermembrane receptor protein, partial [Flavobacteriaceae bacterium]
MLFLFFKKRLSVIWGLFFILPLSLAAQKDTTLLNEVVVAAPLIPSSLLMAPTAISVVNAVSIQPATTQLSLKEYLGQIPGLFAQNQFNYNQDLRIAIRGFGARAAFGIRGVQIIIDGIPETT